MERRLPQLFLLICHQNMNYEIKELAELFSVSTRTIYNDIKKINELLLAKNHSEIKIEKGSVFNEKNIPISFEKLINLDTDYILSHPKIRRLRILSEVLMFENQFSIDDLKEKLTISRNTILSDLKWVKDELRFHQIELISRPFIGYHITGDERDIRQLLIITFQEDPLIFEDGLEIEEELKIAERLLTFCSDSLNISLSDSSYERLKITFWVTFKRINLGKKVIISANNTKEEKFLLKNRLLFNKELGVRIPIEELIYLAHKLIESSLINYKDEINEKWLDYNLLAADFINKVAELSECQYFLEDNLLYIGIVNHLRPAFHRVHSKSDINNPMFDYIIQSYQSLHSNVCKGMRQLEKHLSIRFTEQETSFFTLFFIASLERMKNHPAKLKNIIIVCDAGVSTSQILRSKLEVNFDVVIQGTFGKRTVIPWLKENKTDLIISTIPFQYPGIKSIQVAPFLTEEDLKQLYLILNTKREKIDINEILLIINEELELNTNQLNRINEKLMNYFKCSNEEKAEKGGYQPMLLEVLNENLIHTNSEAKNREEAVIASGKLLVDNGLANQSYIEGMLENLEINGTYIVISPGIAMPHARPETGALAIGISIVTLKNPVTFGHPKNDPVSIVIGLCAIDHQSHLRALSELVEILSDEEKINDIKDAESSAKIMKIIKGGK